MVYGMAGQSAWSNPFPRGHATFGNGVGMNIARQRGNYDGNTFARSSLIFWGSERALYEQSWEAHLASKAGSNLHSIEVNGIVYLPDVNVGSDSSGWAAAFEQHVYENSPYYNNGIDSETNVTMNNLNAFGLGWSVKESIIEGALGFSKEANTSIGLAKYMKVSRALGVAGSVITTGYSANEVANQYNNGGTDEVFKHRDIIDAGVGTVGLGATALAAFGIISNPVGWGIGIGVLIYGGATLIYDANND